MAELNKIRGLVVGQYGTPITITVTDSDGVAVDLSSYSPFTVTLRDPTDSKTIQYTAEFVTSGTDGKLKFTPASGDIDIDGIWHGQIKLQKANVVEYTQTFEVTVERNLG